MVVLKVWFTLKQCFLQLACSVYIHDFSEQTGFLQKVEHTMAKLRGFSGVSQYSIATAKSKI